MHLSIESLHHLLSTWGYLAVFGFVGVESTGIPIPGETMLIVAAAYASTGHLTIAWVIAAAVVGAIVGDNLGYLIGRTGGREVALRLGHYIGLHEERLDLAERFFQQHGDKTVFFGRFVAILRAWAAFLAGVNRMPWPKFLLFNAAGGICWATLYGLLAYFFGQALLERVSGAIGVGGLVIVALLVLVAILLHRRGWTLEKLLERHILNSPAPAVNPTEPEQPPDHPPVAGGS